MTVFISLLTAALLAGADQLLKYLVQLRLQPVGQVLLIDGFIGLRYLRNTGAAFGSFSSSTVLLSIFTAAVLAVGVYLIAAGKIKSKYCLVCVVLIISGGLGNLIDRVFRGYVIDYIEVLFTDFAVFNFADILVTVGAFMLVGYVIADAVRSFRSRNSEESK